jgi:hypothetical protein
MQKQQKRLDNYCVTGTAKDHEWIIDHRELFETAMREEMRQKGFIPALDLPINIVWEYDKNFLCHFKAIAKGLKVGRKRSLEAMGYMSREGFIVGKDAAEVALV